MLGKGDEVPVMFEIFGTCVNNVTVLDFFQAGCQPPGQINVLGVVVDE